MSEVAHPTQGDVTACESGDTHRHACLWGGRQAREQHNNGAARDGVGQRITQRTTPTLARRSVAKQEEGILSRGIAPHEQHERGIELILRQAPPRHKTNSSSSQPLRIQPTRRPLIHKQDPSYTSHISQTSHHLIITSTQSTTTVTILIPTLSLRHYYCCWQQQQHRHPHHHHRHHLPTTAPSAPSR